ncbi:unnamed protein product, partial [Amoebophrya sp. A120]
INQRVDLLRRCAMVQNHEDACAGCLARGRDKKIEEIRRYTEQIRAAGNLAYRRGQRGFHWAERYNLFRGPMRRRSKRQSRKRPSPSAGAAVRMPRALQAQGVHVGRPDGRPPVFPSGAVVYFISGGPHSDSAGWGACGLFPLAGGNCTRTQAQAPSLSQQRKRKRRAQALLHPQKRMLMRAPAIAALWPNRPPPNTQAAARVVAKIPLNITESCISLFLQ